jgi:hypothetical protein
LLLFATNVAAILGTGIVVMAIYGVHRMVPAAQTAQGRAINRRNAVLVIAAMVLIVGIPLTTSSVTIIRDTDRQVAVRDAGRAWASSHGWDLVAVTSREGRVVARFEGPPPIPDIDSLEPVLRERGVDPNDVRAELLPRATVDLGD